MTVSFRLFIVAAIVLIVFAIIASAQDSGTLFTVSALTWLCATLLAYFCDIALSWSVGERPRA